MAVLSAGVLPTEIKLETSQSMLEFRCNRCWQSNFASCEATGDLVDCRNCGNEISVPEVTPERIARALELMEATLPTAFPKNQIELDRPFTDKEIVALAAKESFVPLKEMDFRGHSLASLWSRLFAHLIDGFLLVLTLMIGGLLVYWLSKQGYLELNDSPSDQVVVWPFLFSFATVLVLSQWVLLSTCGQTLGKKLCMIRVVTMSGRLPGFVQGVFLRNWMRVVLTAIPFFALFDLLFALGNSKRCLHDLLSGTRVVGSI